MKIEWLGIVGVLAVAFAIAGYKSIRSTGPTNATAGTSKVGDPFVVLIADMREVDDPCPCGEIIRSVRAGAARGIPTKEIDTATSPDLAASYKIQVPPAVLFFDGNGREVRRFEGESPEYLAAIRSALELLPTKKP